MSDKADNIHYTDFRGLYYILKEGGIKGRPSGYFTKTSKTKDDDMEFSTVRNTHKLSEEEKASLSQSASGGIRINLFTDRILSSHRGTRKATIAEFPPNRETAIKNNIKMFIEEFGFEPPTLYKKDEFKSQFPYERNQGNEIVKKWLKETHPEYLNNGIVIDFIYNHNHNVYHLKEEIIHREREERLILKKPIPIKPEYIEIIIEHLPTEFTEDCDFYEEHKKKLLNLIKENEKVFIKNKIYEELINENR